MAYAQQVMPGKAIDRLTGAGLAPDTQETFKKIRAKFVQPPPSQASSSRPPAPESNMLSEELVAKATSKEVEGVSEACSNMANAQQGFDYPPAYIEACSHLYLP